MRRAVEALCALACAVPAAVAWSAPPRRITAEIPSLSTSGPRLIELFRWAALAEPELDPARLAARLEPVIGLDPWSAPALAAAGVDAARPIRVRFEADLRQIVVEVALADPARARAHAEALRVQNGGAPLEGAAGFVLGAEPADTAALLVRDKDAVAILGASFRRSRAVGTATGAAARAAPAVKVASDRRLAAASPRGKRGAVKAPKALLDGAPVDLWVVLEPRDDVERVDLVVRTAGGAAQVDGQIALGLGAEVVLGEGLRGRSRAVRLVDAGPVALELSTTLTRAGLREGLERLGLAPALAAPLAGPVHVGVADDGTAFAAAILDPKADAKPLVDALRRLEGADVQASDGRLWARLGARALAPAKAEGPARGALAVDVVPAHVLGALDRHRALLGIRPMALMMARLLVGRLVSATESIAVDASMPDNRLRFTARVRFSAPR